MAKTLVTYFSASSSRITERFAKALAKELNAELFEIAPVSPYTEGDINWVNPLSRCNKEHIGKKDVPVSGKIGNFAEYDTVFIGFPIWYGCAPNVVNTFCKEYDWRNHKIYAFATSGGSGIGKSGEKLSAYTNGAEVTEAKLVNSPEELINWAKQRVKD